MFSNPFGLDARRRRLLKRAPAGPLRDFLSVPFPAPDTPIDRVPILSVDFETTGLDPRRDRLLSIGCVQVERARVELASACHLVVRGAPALETRNVAVHQITDDQVAAGLSPEEAVGRLLERLAGRVMLAHHARVERGFLQATCRKLWGLAPVWPVIDTLHLARRTLERRSRPPQGSELRLFNLRQAEGLPRYKAHNALCDAIATAELFLVQVEQARHRRPPPLRRFLAPG